MNAWNHIHVRKLLENTHLTQRKGHCWIQDTLTHWGRVTHICVGKITIIGSNNGISPGRRQAIIWTNAGILLIRPLGTNFSEILIGIQSFWFEKMRLEMSFDIWHPFCLGLNVLIVKPLCKKVCIAVADPLRTPLFKVGILRYANNTRAVYS